MEQWRWRRPNLRHLWQPQHRALLKPSAQRHEVGAALNLQPSRLVAADVALQVGRQALRDTQHARETLPQRGAVEEVRDGARFSVGVGEVVIPGEQSSNAWHRS